MNDRPNRWVGGLAFALWLGVPLAAPSSAQERTVQIQVERIELRVIGAVGEGLVEVDRGARDGVEVGDPVRILTRVAGIRRGKVTQVSDRSSVVQLRDASVMPEPGAQGEVVVPRERLRRRREAAERARAAREDGGGVELEHPPWERKDDRWSEGMPLLAEVKAVRPEDRARTVTARTYLIADAAGASEDSRSDHFLRAGIDWEMNNPFQRGGGMRFDAEWNLRETDVSGQVDENETDLRVDRLSYHSGGNRFERWGWEAGRFLQRGMPEFGVLDGVEIQKRRSNGDRYGISLGTMPEADEDYGATDDLQLALHYLWVADARETLTMGAGFQTTRYEGDPDRDLLVTKLRYLPRDGWRFLGTLWVDFYDSSDNARGEGVELTGALLTTGRRFETGNRIDLTYRRILFPELLRDDFAPLAAATLADDRYDRLSVSGSRWLDEKRRFHGEFGLWDDEFESGGDLELGVEALEVFSKDGSADATFYATRGRFSVSGGGRFSYRKSTDNGQWDLAYEIAEHNQDDFSHDINDLMQHRVHLGRDYHGLGAWDLSVRGDVVVWDDENAWSVGLWLQRSF